MQWNAASVKYSCICTSESVTNGRYELGTNCRGDMTYTGTELSWSVISENKNAKRLF